MKIGISTLVICIALGGIMQYDASAQTSMVGTTPTQRQQEGMQLTLGQMSFTAQPTLAPKTFREHDLIKVHVKQNWRSLNEGELERKRKMNSSYGITKWISFNGLSFGPSKMSGGTPAIGAELDSQFKNEGSVVRRESLEFQITCRIMSIEENGVLFIEGTDTTTLAEEGKIVYCSGFVQPQDVRPDNSINSDDLHERDIREISSGSVPDSYRRNWGQKAIDRFSPF